MQAADTNVLIRVLIRDNETQTLAADKFVKSETWISVVCLAETIWVISKIYSYSRSRIADALEMLLNHESFVLQDAQVVGAALDLFRARPSLGFSDCLILEAARKAGHLPLGTFDRALARCEGAQKL